MAAEHRFRFPLPRGLHARPAAALSAAAAAHPSAITLANLRTGREANAKSTLALVATLTREGDECAVRVAGGDEAAALEAVRRFLAVELPLCDVEPAAEPAHPGAGAPLPRALRREGVRVLRGAPAACGIGAAAAVVLGPGGAPRRAPGPALGSPREEAERFARARAEVGAELRREGGAARNETERAILAAHLAILEDPELSAEVLDAVRAPGVSAARAAVDVADRFASMLLESGSALLAERAADVRDVAARLLGALDPALRGERTAALERDAVVVAEQLTPAQFMAIHGPHLKGLVLGGGGATSHTAILARADRTPCVTGARDAVRALRDGDEVIVDGERGLAVAGPPPEVRRFYALQSVALAEERAREDRIAARRAVTSDGRRVEVLANVGSLTEARLALDSGAEGIGLFRTELLFMDREQAPSEDEQAEVYAEAARLAGGRPVTIRTLDVGGDKPVPYLGLPAERNPFLGFRAIRMYDAHPDVAGAQVRAILRASAAGRVRMMFPMVASLDEVRALRGLVREQMVALSAAGVPFDPAIEVGIMVEVPALAFAMDEVAREVDFVSVGSNDLLQYLLAVDRDNERVAHLYEPLQPAFLRALAAVVRGAHTHGRRVALCGELGGDARAVPLLVGLGVDELSVGAARIAGVKSAIGRSSAAACAELAGAALASATPAEVAGRLRAFAASAGAGPVLVPALVRLQSGARTKDEAIRELADTLRLEGRLADADRVEDAVWLREESGSTGVGFGIAIPHCRSEAVLATSLAVASYPQGVEWGSLDGEPVRMAIMIAVSAAAGDDVHLRMIAALSRRLMDDPFREALLAAGSAAEVVERVEVAVGVREAVE